MEYSKPYLGQLIEVVIDRPRGSVHPEYSFIYPVNYGYVPGTQAPDGDGLDAYVLGVDEELEKFTGRCIAILHRTNDDDDKLIVCREGHAFSDEQIREQTRFQEQWFESKIIRQ